MRHSIRLACALALLHGAQAFAIGFHQPAQPLAQALPAVARKAGIDLLYNPPLLAGKTAPALKGDFTGAEALRRLLEGNGLELVFTGPSTATVRRAQATQLPALTVTAEPVDETGYSVYSASTATKTNTPIMETPLSIQVVPQAVLNDQQVTTLQQAMQNVSGVSFTPSTYNAVDAFTIRGFRVEDTARFRNGMRFPGYYNASFANIKRVEVLKGPGAVLYGRLQPGGIINLVTKKPQAEPHYSLQQQFGSYNFYRTALDATGPINDGKTLLYRAIFGYTNAESFRDKLFNETFFVSPSLTWRPWEGMAINLSYQYRQEDAFSDSGIPVRFVDAKEHIPPVPISNQYNEGGGVDINSHLVNLNWSQHFHALNTDWILRNGFQYQQNEFTYRTIGASRVLEDGRTVARYVDFAHNEEDYYLVFVDLTAKFQLWGMDHTVLVGWNYFKRHDPITLTFSKAGQDISVDLFNPVLGRVNLEAIQSQPPSLFAKTVNSWHGVYFQDQMSLFDDTLHILGGGRYDWAEAFSGSSSTSFSDLNQKSLQEEQFSPRVGVVYQPWPWLSLYGNYVQSFGASNGRTADGSPLPPQEAEQYEVGVKTEFFGGRLSSTLAFYHLTKTNLPADNLNTPDPRDRITIGEARSQGIELSMRGQLTKRMSVIATYALTDADITKGTTRFPQGIPLPAVPEHQGSLWAKYQVIPSRFEVGSGVYLVGDRPGIPGKTPVAPAYVRWDAFAAYHMDLGKTRLTFQVNVRNILDEKYFHATRRAGGVLFPGAPRTVIGLVRFEF